MNYYELHKLLSNRESSASICELHRKILDPAFSTDERARLRCRLAKQLQQNQDYEVARAAMGELWFDIGEPRNLEELKPATRAEVLLRVGALTGYRASSLQIGDSQKRARDLLNESIRIFTSLRDARKVAEAETEVGYCYAREGELDDARVMFAKARALLDDQDGDLKAVAILRCFALEKLTNRLREALNILMATAALFEASENDTLKGYFHNEFASVLKDLSASEDRADYIERAVSEYSAASFYLERAGYTRDQADVELNLAKLLLKLDRLKEAHEHLDRAESLLTPLKDDVRIAPVKKKSARIRLPERDFVEAEQARAVFEHPIKILKGGYMEISDLAPLTEFEHLAANLSEEEIIEFLQIVKDLQRTTGHTPAGRTPEFQRHIARAHRYLTMHGFFGPPNWTNLPHCDALHQKEAHYVRMALEDAGGVISQAAYLLRIPCHQLRYMLKRYHQDLSYLVTAVWPESDPAKGATVDLDEAANRRAEAIRILYVDKDRKVTTSVKQAVQRQGWTLTRCGNGKTALKKLVGSDDQYELVLLDYELPGLNGLELIARMRDFFELRHMPIVMLSATLDEAAALEAGADAFLRKPEEIALLGETIISIFALDNDPGDKSNRSLCR